MSKFKYVHIPPAWCCGKDGRGISVCWLMCCIPGAVKTPLWSNWEVWLILSGDTERTKAEFVTMTRERQSTKTGTQVFLVEKPLVHHHLFSFSCRTHKAADRGEWGLSAAAEVAPDCRRWCTLASPGPTAARDHLWVYTRGQSSPGNTEALSASRSLAVQDSGRSRERLGRPLTVRPSSRPGREGAAHSTLHSGGMTTPRRLSLSAESQLFQRLRGETSSRGSWRPAFRPSKGNVWLVSLCDRLQPSDRR